MEGRKKIGGGGEDFLEKVLPAPSKPLPPLPKTFDLIESLLSFFPGGKGNGLSENQKTKKAD